MIQKIELEEAQQILEEKSDWLEDEVEITIARSSRRDILRVWAGTVEPKLLGWVDLRSGDVIPRIPEGLT